MDCFSRALHGSRGPEKPDPTPRYALEQRAAQKTQSQLWLSTQRGHGEPVPRWNHHPNDSFHPSSSTPGQMGHTMMSPTPVHRAHLSIYKQESPMGRTAVTKATWEPSYSHHPHPTINQLGGTSRQEKMFCWSPFIQPALCFHMS